MTQLKKLEPGSRVETIVVDDIELVRMDQEAKTYVMADVSEDSYDNGSATIQISQAELADQDENPVLVDFRGIHELQNIPTEVYSDSMNIDERTIQN